MSYCKEQCSYYKAEKESGNPSTAGGKCPMLRLELLSRVQTGGHPDLSEYDATGTKEWESVQHVLRYLEHHAELDAEDCARDAQQLSPEEQAEYVPFDVVPGDQIIDEIKSLADFAINK